MGGTGQIGVAAHALRVADSILGTLRQIANEVKWQREFEEGRKHFTLSYGLNIQAGGETVESRHNVPQGYAFVVERVMATAPEGCQLEVFEGQPIPANLKEVVANIQQFTEGSQGWIIEGGAKVTVIVTKAKAAGPVSIVISGQLVAKLPAYPGTV